MDTKKVAIVTGGLSGMGFAVTRRLARDGYAVHVGARRGDQTALTDQIADRIDGEVAFAGLDVRDTRSCEDFAQAVHRDRGRIDVLVNAAGVYDESPVDGHPDALWDDTIDTNLTGTFKMIRAVLPHMRARSWGRIVNIASVAAHQGMENNAAYCASKSGLLGLGRCVSLEEAANGITCNSISPTWVETEMLKRFMDAEVADGAPRDEVTARYRASNPQGQLVQPEEIAELVAFLTSDAGRAMTMADYQVNAGSLW